MKNRYKSPWSALLWSLVLPGFGQFYNGQLFIGFVLMVLEVLINYSSNLNLAIFHTFRGELQQAHQAVHYNWGLFYPSLWGYGMWQAYNQAISINDTLREKGIKEPIKKAEFTGMLCGLVAGMVLGLLFQSIFISPVYTGLALGVIGAIIGYTVERLMFNFIQQKSPTSIGEE